MNKRKISYYLFIWLVSFLPAVKAFAQTDFIPETVEPMTEQWRWNTYPQINSIGALCMIEDQEGTLWFGGNGKIVSYNGMLFRNFGKEEGIPEGQVIMLKSDKTGNIYACIRNFGIYRLTNGQWKLLFPLNGGGGPTAMEIDSNDKIWTSTEKGIVRLLGENLEVYTPFGKRPINEYYEPFSYSKTTGSDFGFWQMMWDNENLYLHVLVNDAIRIRDSKFNHDDDCIEVHLDIGNKKTSTVGSNVFLYQIRVQDDKIVEQNHNAIKGVEFQYEYFPKQTSCRIKIPWTTLNCTPETGDTLGFDVMVQNDDDGGEREMKLAWFSNDDIAYKNPEMLGEISLKPESKWQTGKFDFKQFDIWKDRTQNKIDNIVLFPSAVSMCADLSGNIYLGFPDGKIARISKEDPKTGVQINYDIRPKNSGYFGWPTLSTLRDESVVVATHNPNYGIFIYKNHQWEEIKLSKYFGGSEDSYHCAIELKNGSMLVGGYNKLAVRRNNNWTVFNNPEIPISVDVPIEFMYETKNGKVWIIERGNRVWRFDQSFDKWQTFKNILFQLEEPSGKQWFISSDSKVVSQLNDRWQSWDLSDGVIDTPVKIIQSNSGQILVAGTNNKSAAISLFQNGKWITKEHPKFSWGVSSQSISEGANGKIYFGTVLEGIDPNQTGGILCFQNKNIPFNSNENWEIISFPSIPAEYAYCIAATKDSGFYGGISLFFKYKNGKSDIIDLGSENIYNTVKLINGAAWVGTQANGLYHQEENGKWKNYNVEDGLPSNTVVDLCEFDSNHIFVLTDKGIGFFDGNTFCSKLFPSEIEGNTDNNEIHVSTGKQVWINSIPREWKLRGLHTNSLQTYYTQSTRFITDTLAPNTKITSSIKSISLPGELIVTWQGTDSWGDTPDELLEFSYRINNGDWQPFFRQKSLVLKDLKAGNYVFEVRARDNDFNIENLPARLNFEVLPPVYKRAWFVGMIVLFLTIIIFLIFLLFKNRVKHALIIEKVKSDKLREMDIARVRFFTNISHELRTPLTLILSYTNKLNEVVSQLPEKSVRHFELLKSNTGRLHRIVNQVLDLRKLQVGELKLEPVYDDLVLFLNRCTDAFRTDAVDKNIELNFRCSHKQFFTYFDNIKLEHIIYNLLSNALKFTHKGFVHIDLKIETDKFIIKVEDSGIGISENELGKIFNRFYQVDDSHKKQFQGTGVGLSLVKEMVGLYKGDIKTESKVDIGTTFYVELPVLKPDSKKEFTNKENRPAGAENDSGDQPDSLANDDDDDAKHIEGKPMVLIVEDNAEIRQHLKEELEDEYQIIEAEDGIFGRDKAMQLIPDLIISDVMMPRLDGNELCSILKNDERTSHIPVIILTVLDSEQSHITSLNTGADDHINKPFSISLVKSRIANLLLNRKQLRDKLSRAFLMKPHESETISLDDILLKKCHGAINENLSDPDFDVARLADKLNITQKQLYRKLKSLLNITPVQYIRILKLNRAAELMIKTDYTISQITYEVGFQDLRYFRNIFKEQFLCTPSEYIQKNKASGQSMSY